MNNSTLDDLPVMSLPQVLLLLGAVMAGALAAVWVLPHWAPGMSASLVSAEPKAFWYLSRASALVAYALLWLSMALGTLITNRLARLWPGGPVAFDVHQHASLLGLGTALFHALILLGDRFINYTLGQILLPFASGSYRPLEVGLGQVAFYGLAVVALSFYVRSRIGPKTWRALHYLSFVVFGLSLWHAVGSGSDTAQVALFYWVTGGVWLFVTVYRVFVGLKWVQ